MLIVCYDIQLKKQCSTGPFADMADSKAEIGQVQDEPGTSCYARKEVFKKKEMMGNGTKIQKPVEGAPHWSNPGQLKY